MQESSVYQYLAEERYQEGVEQGGIKRILKAR